MKKFFLLLLLIGQFVFSQNKTTTLYFIRHAEKVDNSKNPDLSTVGLERAKHWNAVFSGVLFDAVYSTDFARTLQTATPTATAQNSTITKYDPKTIDIEKFQTDNLGKTVLIVGHSNTTPDFVNKLLKQNMYPIIEDTTFGNLYIVTINGAIINHQLLKFL